MVMPADDLNASAPLRTDRGIFTNSILAVVIFLLVLANLMVATLYWRGGGQDTLSRLNDAQVQQLDKLFAIASDFQQELEKVAADAKYESDTEKTTAKQIVAQRELVFSELRIAHLAAQRSRRPTDLVAFINRTLESPNFGQGFMDIPSFKRFVPATYDSNYREVVPSKWIDYGNVSKLETLSDTFKVFAKSLLDEIH